MSYSAPRLPDMETVPSSVNARLTQRYIELQFIDQNKLMCALDAWSGEVSTIVITGYFKWYRSVTK